MITASCAIYGVIKYLILQITEDTKERLIEAVRERRPLWDITDARYKDSIFTENQWSFVTESLQLPCIEGSVNIYQL